ncbi:MAG TPA: general stress protein [Proteiniclasticum sp.]|nr:general stress protein [Proteiniclasticum sp.]
MKKLVGTFRTEEEAILAINHLKEKGLDPNEISVVTNEPYDYKTIKGSTAASGREEVVVGNFYHGRGVNEFMGALTNYGIPPENATVYNDRFKDGNILVFIGVHDEIRNHIENPGNYRAPDLLIDDNKTPGTYTILERFNEDPENPGTYVAADYGFRKTTPGTYVDPSLNDEILTPGTITEDDVINPPHHMHKVDDDVEPVDKDFALNERELEDNVHADKVNRNVSVDEIDPLDPDRPLH